MANTDICEICCDKSLKVGKQVKSFEIVEMIISLMVLISFITVFILNIETLYTFKTIGIFLISISSLVIIKLFLKKGIAICIEKSIVEQSLHGAILMLHPRAYHDKTKQKYLLCFKPCIGKLNINYEISETDYAKYCYEFEKDNEKVSMAFTNNISLAKKKFKITYDYE